jgi:capsular exopolysaccharide synthesis family protein
VSPAGRRERRHSAEARLSPSRLDPRYRDADFTARSRMESGETRNLSDYLGVLRRRIRLIIFIVLLAGGVALALSLARSAVYEASTNLQFTDPGLQASGVLSAGTVDFFPQNEAGAGAARVTREDVLRDASHALGGDPTPDQLRSDTSVAVNTGNNLVSVTVSADTAKKAAREANQLATSVTNLTREDARNFYEQRATTLPKGTSSAAVKERLRTLAAVAEPVTIVRPAEVPDSPASPKPVRDTLIAVFLGLMLGIGIAFVRETLDKRATDAHEVQRRLGLPLVGYVRKDSLGMVGLSRNGANGAGPVSEADLEAFRILRKNVDFLGGDEELKVIAVTSPLPEEGKSTVASWYAYASALVGKRTVLVECDFRRPVHAARLGFDAEPGLSDYLASEANPQQVLRTIEVHGRSAENLAVIPAGGTVLQPTEMLASKRYRDFLNQLRKVYDRVVIDCAPLLPVGDTLEIVPQVDGVLLCVRLRQTTIDQAAAAKQTVEHLPEKPMGLVVTGLTRGSDDDYYGYYSSEMAQATEGVVA